MARNDDLLKGVAIGLGAVVVVPVVIAALAPVVRPMARSALKAGIWAYERGREKVEEFGETVDDIVAEVEEEEDLNLIKLSNWECVMFRKYKMFLPP